MKIPISVFMITFNNAATIEKALKSIKDWSDEIVVVDSHSTDGTQEIVKKYTDSLYQFDTKNLRDKYQYAQDMCKNDWVMFIDADEWLTDEIKKEIAGIISSRTDYAGFTIKRRNIYFGKEIKFGGWYPDYEIRLYKKDKGSWKGGIHAKVFVEGKIGKLKNHYLHTPYLDTSQQIKTIDRYSQQYAEDLYNSNKRFHLINMIFRPFYRFFRDYIFKLGFLDGIPGLIIIASTMYYVFMKHAKLWELEKKNGKKGNF